jgi:omega-6 fatty acid desaturase (delta-12 desaturase)
MSISSAEEYQKARLKIAHLGPNNWRAGASLLGEITVTTAALWLSSRTNPLLWFSGQLWFGIIMWQWFTILHSCGHSAYFKNAVLNDLTGHLAAPFCILPYYPWKYIHSRHHVWAGWKDLDPTMQDISSSGPRKLPEWFKRVIDFCWKYWVPIFSLAYIFQTFWNLKRSNAVAGSGLQKFQNALSVVLLVATYIFLIFHFGGGLFKFAVLSMFVFLTIADLSVLSQHVYLPQKYANGRAVKPFSPHEQDAYSRTVQVAPWVSKWIFFSFNSHSMHHVFPWLPHYYADRVEFTPANPREWKSWLREARRMPAHVLLYENGPANPEKN